MRKAYKFRMYPNSKVNRILNNSLECVRNVYNFLLNKNIELYNERKEQQLTNPKIKISVSEFEMNKIATQERKTNFKFQCLHSQVIQDISNRINLAFQAFYRRVKNGEKPGFPRFKQKGRYDSITFPQNNGMFKLENNKLKLSKIGTVQIKLHREIVGDIKTCTITKSKTGKWHVCFSVDYENEILPLSYEDIAIDLNLENFATFSNGERIENPRFFKQSEKELNELQSAIDKSPKGGSKKKVLQKQYNRKYEKISNQRKDFVHKESRKIVNRFQLICVEDLNIKNMLKKKEEQTVSEFFRNKKRNTNIHDVAWNMFVNCLIYKAEDAGRFLQLVDPRNTSKMCSQCGKLVEKDLSERTHKCPYCGLEINRDLNASYNILRLGTSLSISGLASAKC